MCTIILVPTEIRSCQCCSLHTAVGMHKYVLRCRAFSCYHCTLREGGVMIDPMRWSSGNSVVLTQFVEQSLVTPLPTLLP